MTNDNSEHKKAKGVNENVVVTIIHNENEGALLNKKCFRYWLNEIQIKDDGMETYEINKISLS